MVAPLALDVPEEEERGAIRALTETDQGILIRKTKDRIAIDRHQEQLLQKRIIMRISLAAARR